MRTIQLPKHSGYEEAFELTDADEALRVIRRCKKSLLESDYKPNVQKFYTFTSSDEKTFYLISLRVFKQIRSKFHKLTVYYLNDE